LRQVEEGRLIIDRVVFVDALEFFVFNFLFETAEDWIWHVLFS